MEKIKQYINSAKGKDILVVIIVIIVGLGSFVLGRMSKENDQNNNQEADIIASIPDVGLPQSGIPTSQSTYQNSSSKPFFASSKGKKYYTSNCSAGKNIKTANLVYFDTGAQAEAKGYTLSSSCK